MRPQARSYLLANCGNSNRRVNQSDLAFLLTRPGFIEGLERSDNPGDHIRKDKKTLKGFGNWRTLSGLIARYIGVPRVLAALEPWAEISERLRRLWRKTPQGRSFLYRYEDNHPFNLRLYLPVVQLRRAAKRLLATAERRRD